MEINKKKYIIAWEGNYHGKTLNAQMISGQFSDQKWIPQFDKNIIHLPFPYPWLLKKSKWQTAISNSFKILKKKINLNQISSFFVESFQGGELYFTQKII